MCVYIYIHTHRERERDTMEYLSAIKKNAFESVLVRWMNIQPVIHSGVSHKEKNKISYTNTYTWKD